MHHQIASKADIDDSQKVTTGDERATSFYRYIVLSDYADVATRLKLAVRVGVASGALAIAFYMPSYAYVAPSRSHLYMRGAQVLFYSMAASLTHATTLVIATSLSKKHEESCKRYFVAGAASGMVAAGGSGNFMTKLTSAIGLGGVLMFLRYAHLKNMGFGFPQQMNRHTGGVCGVRYLSPTHAVSNRNWKKQENDLEQYY